ncbi:hypothetical protein ACLBWP_13670 [Microbacterium sp. M1A1_1b]
MAPILRDVHVWPPIGFPGQKWDVSEQLGIVDYPVDEMDALLRGSRKVSELLSEALEARRIVVPRSSIQLMPAGLSDTKDLHVQVLNWMNDGDDLARVFVPEGFHNLSASVRDQLTLRMWEETLRFFAERRGWDPSAVSEAVDAVGRTDCTREWVGPSKWNPGRSMQMRLVGSIHDDGFLRLQVETEDRRGATRRSEPVIGGTTRPGFQRAARAARWSSPTTVRVSVLPSALTGGASVFEVETTTGQLVGGDDSVRVIPITPTGPASPVGFRLTLERHDAVSVRWGGSGPMNNVPHAYSVEMDRLGDVIRSPRWLTWWAQAEVDEVTGYVDHEPATSTPVVQFQRRKLMLIVRRPTASIPTVDAEASALARADLDAAIHRVAVRRSLNSPPPLD